MQDRFKKRMPSGVLMEEAPGQPQAYEPRSLDVIKPRTSTASLHLNGHHQESMKSADGAYHLKIAKSPDLRRRGRALAHRIYQGRGYARSDELVPEPSTFDRQENTFHLLAEDNKGHVIATVTLVYDSPQNLPCDKIFATELGEMRQQGRKMVEVTRLALDPVRGKSRQLLVSLFNTIYLHARRIRNYEDFLIEVNPRHVNFYQRLLGFTPLSKESEGRSCPRVQNAPAVLLSLDLAHPESEIKRVGGLGARSRERSLYPHFLTNEAEANAIAFLEKTDDYGIEKPNPKKLTKA